MAISAFIGVPGLAGITGMANGASTAYSVGGFINDIGKSFNDKAQEIIEGPGKAWDNFKGAVDSIKKKTEDTTGRWLDLISEVFLRSVVVITGFIFVAAGLYMFNRQGGGTVIVNQTAKAAKSLGKKVTLQ